MEERYLTVSALTKYIKYKFDNDTHLTDVLLEGEISNFKHHSRGHFYFTLKDDGAQISAMMFQSYASKVKFEPQDGMKVYVRGTITVYEASGVYQIVVKEMKSDGVGDLYLAYEKLKKELQEAGYFNPEHKRSIPRLPKVVGVITSPTGAAVHDIINTIGRRFPLCKLILYPALVQGEGAKESIVKQISKANEDNLCDVIICGRGGGSIEDLWAFNEKIVAMAIYNSKIPIISAVGHEVDFTIADFVADKRAATPTAAAEIATPSVDNLKEYLSQAMSRISHNINIILNDKKTQIMHLDRSLDNLKPITKLQNIKKELDFYVKRLNMLITSQLNDRNSHYHLLNEKLKALSPLTIMDKGYSIPYVEGKVVRSVKMVHENDNITLAVNDGKINCKVLGVEENGK
ncbi:MAG: exodeoxyribonuclease VII large subunit [Acholeplasmatales bacterium]|nr:exodeoxyribonuclease VII large subunit [Acholeplasmatales bacterium]